MPEQSQQQAQSTPASQEQRQHLLDQLKANKKAVEELSDVELEAVAGGFMIAGGPSVGMPSREMTARPMTAVVRSTGMPGPVMMPDSMTGSVNPSTGPSRYTTMPLTEPPPMTPMENDNRPIV